MKPSWILFGALLLLGVLDFFIDLTQEGKQLLLGGILAVVIGYVLDSLSEIKTKFLKEE